MCFPIDEPFPGALLCPLHQTGLSEEVEPDFLLVAEAGGRTSVRFPEILPFGTGLPGHGSVSSVRDSSARPWMAIQSPSFTKRTASSAVMSWSSKAYLRLIRSNNVTAAMKRRNGRIEPPDGGPVETPYTLNRSGMNIFGIARVTRG
jgi:hypothetical protein